MLTLQTSITAGIAGHILDPMFSCPAEASSCVWRNVTTLAWCAKQGMPRAPLSDRSCQVVNWSSLQPPESLEELFADDFLAIACNYTLPRPIGSPKGEWIVVNHPFPLWAEERNNRSISAAFGSMAGYSFEGFEVFMVQAPSNTSSNIGPQRDWESVQEAMDAIVASVPQAYGSSTELYPCSRTFPIVSASPAGLHYTPANPIFEERLVYANSSVIDDPLSWAWAGSPSMAFKSPSTGQLYQFDDLGTGEMVRLVGGMMTCDIESWESVCMYMVHHKNVSEPMEHLALTLSNHLRNPVEGDNMNATLADGLAFFSEVYIAVRWGWVLLPLVETALVVVLLVAVILSTKGERLIKESVVAYLAYGLDERSKAVLDGYAPASGHDMTAVAKQVNVQLVRSSNGGARFAHV